MLGIDVSKAKLECALLDPAHCQFLWQRQVSNSQEGIKQLLACTPAEVPWVMEPTGRFSLQVAKTASLAGRRVLLAPSKRAKRFAESIQSRVKSDKTDSRSLALFGQSQSLPSYPIKS